MLPRGPLSRSYAGALWLVIFSLVPFLSLSAAVIPLAPVIGRGLHLSSHALDVAVAMSTGAYSVGTVLSVQFGSRLPARRMLVVYETAFAAAAAITAWSPSAWVFIVGFVVLGLCTSLLLIAAVPPLVTGFGPERLPLTGSVMNLCIFGAVAIGPTIGAVEAAGHGWRPLFWGVTAVAVFALTLSLLTYQDQPPSHPEAPVDLLGVGLAVAGCGLAFFGAGELQASRAAGAVALAPLLAGAAMLVTLIVYEYRARRPLMPVKQLATTFPVFGIFGAATASAASFALTELVLVGLQKSSTPATTGLLFLPEFVGAIAMAGLFGRLFASRYTPVMVIGGLLVLVGAAALLLVVGPSARPLVGLDAGMLGLGVGASVSPALFVVGFTLRSSEIQRVFALVELIRGVTAFLVAPVLAFVAVTVSVSAAVGFAVVAWICLGIAAAGAAGGLLLLWSGGARLQVPDLGRWQEGEPAWHSSGVRERVRSSGVGNRRGEPPGTEAEEPGRRAAATADDARAAAGLAAAGRAAAGRAAAGRAAAGRAAAGRAAAGRRDPDRDAEGPAA